MPFDVVTRPVADNDPLPRAGGRSARFPAWPARGERGAHLPLPMSSSPSGMHGAASRCSLGCMLSRRRSRHAPPDPALGRGGLTAADLATTSWRRRAFYVPDALRTPRAVPRDRRRLRPFAVGILWRCRRSRGLPVAAVAGRSRRSRHAHAVFSCAPIPRSARSRWRRQDPACGSYNPTPDTVTLQSAGSVRCVGRSCTGQCRKRAASRHRRRSVARPAATGFIGLRRWWCMTAGVACRHKPQPA